MPQEAPSQAMSGSQPSQDPGDRAQMLRKGGSLIRIPLHKIGFWPGNRGGLGISPHIAMEVTWDCMANKTKQARYGHVDLVLIPPDLRDAILQANRHKCENEPMMPPFSPDIEYVCATKTHFTHAQKLCHESTNIRPRTLFNNGHNTIKWQDDDTEGRKILECGIMAVTYDWQLLREPDAMSALASDYMAQCRYGAWFLNSLVRCCSLALSQANAYCTWLAMTPNDMILCALCHPVFAKDNRPCTCAHAFSSCRY